MRTIETTAYKFAELSESAQQKAIERLYDINVDHSWWDFTFNDAKRIGLELTSFDLDRNKHAKGELMYAANEVCANIFKEHGETCETYKTAKAFMAEWEPIFSDYMDENSPNYESRESESKLQDLEADFLESLLEGYANILQNEYEYLTSKEAIIETIEANDYEFTEQGKLI